MHRSRDLFHSLRNPKAQNRAQHIVGAQGILVECGKRKSCPLSPFPLPSGWNVDMVAGAGTDLRPRVGGVYVSEWQENEI